MTEAQLEIVHQKLGPLRVRADEVLQFDGIPGFPQARRFALVEHDRGEHVAWLASLDDPELAFAVVDLRSMRADVCADLTAGELAAVDADDPSTVEVFGIVNLRHSPPRVLLDAPILVHRETRRAVQLVRGHPIAS